MKNVLFGDSLCQALCNNSHIQQVCFDLLQTHLPCDSSKYPIFQVQITRLDAENKCSFAIWCLTSADTIHGILTYNKYATTPWFFLSCYASKYPIFQVRTSSIAPRYKMCLAIWRFAVSGTMQQFSHTTSMLRPVANAPSLRLIQISHFSSAHIKHSTEI